jgi:hypothetical protein
MTKTRWPVLVCLFLASAAFSLDKAAPGAAPFPVPAPPSLADPVGPPNTTLELDKDSVGVHYRITYDDRGKVLREELDYNRDGRMDTFYYYKDGVLQRVEIDSKFTGKIDIWVYLLDGKYVQRYERDTTGSGKADFVRNFGKE